MPEYLAPGVYVEETSFRPKTIEGVGTSTAGFVGSARFGPTAGEPELLTSFADFERIYGGLDQLTIDSVTQDNFLAHGVRAFFEEGGKRLYVSRVANGATAAGLDIGTDSPASVSLAARHTGSGGNLRVTFYLRHSENVLIEEGETRRLLRVQENDTVAVFRSGSPPPDGIICDVVEDGDGFALVSDSSPSPSVSELDPETDKVVILTVDVEIERPIRRPKRPKLKFTSGEAYEGLAFHPSKGNSLTNFFAQQTNSRRVHLFVPLIISTSLSEGRDVFGQLFDTAAEALTALVHGADFAASDLLVSYTLEGGSDGASVGPSDYRGEELADGTKTGLVALEALEDISIVAAPGSTKNSPQVDDTDIRSIQGALVSHAERMRYRIAVLDTPDGQTLGDVRDYRGRFDSSYAAMYFPWVQIVDPVTEEELNTPPSGFVAGIYARNDVNVGVHKTPANEVVRLAVNFEQLLNKSQQDVLNPAGINCFRFFEGRGYRLWGGRTISSDGEYKYVNVRRYLAYLGASVDRGTQVFVFENNGPKLWENVRQTVSAFLFNEWKSNRLLGFTPAQAYFVRCDLTTMTQNDLDNGRLICEIGVSLLKPAEFVIFRIGQKLLNQ